MFSKRTDDEKHTEKEKRKKKPRKPETPSFLGVSVQPPPSLASGYCTAEQCFLNPPSTASTAPTPQTTAPVFFDQKTTLSPRGNSFLNHSQALPATLEADSHFLATFLPDDLAHSMKEAMKQGLLTSFLLTLPSELLTEKLRSRGYLSEEIFWIQQFLNSFILLALGASLGPTVALPLLHYLLTSQFKASKDQANSVTTGAALTLGLVSSPYGWLETSLTLATTISSSWLGRKSTQAAFSLARNSLFSATSATKKINPTPTLETQNKLNL
jgi:hypothetical protein